MTLTIIKKPGIKVKLAPKIKLAPMSDTTEVQTLVDKIVENNPAILAAKEPKKLQEKARKELLDVISGSYAPKEEINLTGTLGRVQFTPASNKRYCVDPVQVHKWLGDDAFYAIIDVRLGDLTKYLTAAQLEQVIADGVGSRTMNILPLDDK